MVLLLAACQGPLGDRHDLEGLRIAAIEAQVSENRVTARALVTVDGKLYSDTAVEREWIWTDATTDAVQTAGSGSSSTIFEDDLSGPRLVLRIRHDGEERVGFIDPGLAFPFSKIAAEPIALDPAALSVDERMDASEAELLTEEGFARLSVEVEGRVRWMGPAPFGTFLELTDTRTDWTPGTVELDEGETELFEPGLPGIYGVVALVLHQDGGTRFVSRDLVVGERAGTEVSGHWLPGPTLSGPSVVTLVADDTVPLGLAYRDPVPGVEADPVPCLDGATLLPERLLDGRCLRSELLEQQVVLVP